MVIGIFPNAGKEKAGAVLLRLVNAITQHGAQFLMTSDDAAVYGYAEHGRAFDELARNIDCALSIGGDGTMIKCARELTPFGVPVAGINLGKVGFLNDIELANLETAIGKLVKGQYHIKERMMLDVRVLRNGAECYSGIALNDAVISKSGLSRLLRLSVSIASGLVEKYPADGVIISTPTGSTGYSLSANGPIIHPSVKVLTITPICPHLLHSRSIILANDEVITVEFDASNEDAILTLDGQVDYNLVNSDKVIVSELSQSAKLVKLDEYRPFFEVVRDKLHVR